MQRFVPDYLKTKKMCRNTATRLPFVIRYVLDPFKTQEMCDKAILENGGTLKFVLNYYQD